jgi:hypothetical protein
VVSEQNERLPAGPRGQQGKQGERGERGLPRGQARAVVYLFVLAVLLAVAGLFWINHQVHASQGAARQAGQAVEVKLCSTFGRLAALQPPPGNPAANPSRAYLQAEHATLVQLGADLGCNRRPR